MATAPSNNFRESLQRLRRREPLLEQIQAINEQILVRMLPSQAISPGGITLPNAAVDNYGLVLSSGAAVFKPDDMVLFPSHAGLYVNIEGFAQQTFMLVDSRDVIAKLNIKADGGLAPDDFYFQPPTASGEIQGQADCSGEIQSEDGPQDDTPISTVPGEIQGQPADVRLFNPSE